METRRCWSKIPKDTDILLTHNPPYTILDRSSGGAQLGCRDLFDIVTTSIKPKLHLFGHVHAGYGQLTDINQTIFANASLCDSYLRIAHSPIVIDLDK